AHRGRAVLPPTLSSVLDGALGVRPGYSGHRAFGGRRLRDRSACGTVADGHVGRVLRTQDPDRATFRAHVPGVRGLLAVPLPSPGSPCRDRHGGGGERVRRAHLVRPAVLFSWI